MAASDLVKFKRGTMAALEALMAANNGQGAGEDGTFYLTVDDDASGSNVPNKSSRLFVGRADGSIVPVNQGIITVEDVHDLTNGINGKWHAGDYAYVTGHANYINPRTEQPQPYGDGNILAIYDGQNWKQINSVGSDTNTFIAKEDFSADTDNNAATVTLTGTYRSNITGYNGSTISDSFTIAGANGITASGNSKTVTLTGTSYDLNTTINSNNNQATVQLMSKASALAQASEVDSFSISSADANRVRIAGSSDNITIDAAKIASATFTNQSTGGVSLALADNFGGSVSGNWDPTITVKNSSDGLSTTSVHFVNGAANLDVYTTGVIDGLLQGLDALVYRGTVGSGGSYAQDIDHITDSGMPSLHIGDTFKLTGNYQGQNAPVYSNIPIKTGGTAENPTISATGTAKGGDLLIANGIETNGVITTLYYDIIPIEAGQDTTYSISTDDTNHKITVTSSTGSTVGGIQISGASNNPIAVSGASSADHIETVTVGHGVVNAPANLTNDKLNATTDSSTMNANGRTFTAVTDVTVDAFGHTTEYKTKEITIKDMNLGAIGEEFTISAQNDKATIVNTPTAANADGSNATATAGRFIVESDNLKVTAPTPTTQGTPEVKINLMWETFTAPAGN